MISKDEMLELEKYKELLTKQTDVMQQLTEKLNEKDDTIILLEDDIDNLV